ncbi:MAG: prepilin-type N-terminal cleavage/methylation domain-containing protein, partial [Deltaproteobacteria bacterium]|nr:prepilin-type N-terminal cleavage/methylation domain-containing protein [Deltaproteobacteria bacterium]
MGRDAGFTLLEVVIAGALTATLLIVLAQALVKGMATYNQQEIRAELYQMGRVALDRTTRDLRAGGLPVV